MATEFEHRSFSEELQLCKRYYHRIERTEVDGSDTAGAIPRNVAGLYLGIAQITGATTGFVGVDLPTTMRATPTISTNNVSHVSVFPGSNKTLTSFSIVNHKQHKLVFISLGFASGGVANDAARVFINTEASFVEFGAEDRDWETLKHGLRY